MSCYTSVICHRDGTYTTKKGDFPVEQTLKRKSITGKVIYKQNFKKRKHAINGKIVDRGDVDELISKDSNIELEQLNLKIAEEISKRKKIEKEFNKNMYLDDGSTNYLDMVMTINESNKDKELIVNLCNLAITYMESNPIILIPTEKIYINNDSKLRSISDVRRSYMDFKINCYCGDKIIKKVSNYLATKSKIEFLEGTYDYTKELVLEQRDKMMLKRRKGFESHRTMYYMIADALKFYQDNINA